MTATDATTELTDPELISRVRDGDVTAYGTLFSRHVDAATRLARMLVPGPDADDLVSEAFVKVLNVLLGGGGPDVAFRAYLLTAVRRLHVDRLRSTQRATPTGDLTPFDPGVPFTDTAVAGFEGGAAAKAFASLPERWQLVLWHLEVENQKPADIAPLLGISANSVSALAYRAREGLRQAFLTMHAGDHVDEGCRQTHELLGGYVRGGLAKRDAAKVEEHLDHCRSCTGVYLELAEVNSSLAALLGPAVLGAAAAAYLGGGAAVGGAGLGVGALLGRARDLVLANGTASVATAGVVGVVAATAVVVGVHASHGSPGAPHQAPRAAGATGSPSLTDSTVGSTGARQPQARVHPGAVPTDPLTGLPVGPTTAPTTTPTPTAASVPRTAAPRSGGPSTAHHPIAHHSTADPSTTGPGPSSPTTGKGPGKSDHGQGTSPPPPSPRAPPSQHAPAPTPPADPPSTPPADPPSTPPADPPSSVADLSVMAIGGPVVDGRFTVVARVLGVPPGVRTTLEVGTDRGDLRVIGGGCVGAGHALTCSVTPGRRTFVFTVTDSARPRLTLSLAVPAGWTDPAPGNNTTGLTAPGSGHGGGHDGGHDGNGHGPGPNGRGNGGGRGHTG